MHDWSTRGAPAFRSAQELAVQTDDRLTLSYVLRHLGFIEHAAGRLDAARGGCAVRGYNFLKVVASGAPWVR